MKATPVEPKTQSTCMLGGGAQPPAELPPAAAVKTPPAVKRQKISARSL